MKKRVTSDHPDYPPERLRGLRPNHRGLGVTPLAPGELSRGMSVRGPADAVTWFYALAPADRGAVAHTGMLLAQPLLEQLETRPGRDALEAQAQLRAANGDAVADVIATAIRRGEMPALGDLLAYAVSR